MKKYTDIKYRIKIWKEIKKSYAKFVKTGEAEDEAKNGLCYAVRAMAEPGTHLPCVPEGFSEDIFEVRPHGTRGIGYFWYCDQQGAKQRVKAINQIIRNLKQQAV